ncbi:diacylglycerol/lipid kinase family protein [Stakelama saccharophila]|uniref:YegS/Rv2252/BmrU family lipid kinase n=1 Tax=Stakelama saccharophila TaxID=3075605 RepID=A0ABZ0B7L4_9SPHN|nr:YegS/Rv2252/BmrU family lipid kinase [Stakelama sp. W311]WNO52990.1 YegS/Rv2252/BmrU family lipid kinase [Stakelama sp. W311]
MYPIRSAAMIVNAKSRRGRDLFKQACSAMKDLPFPVDARAVRDPGELESTLEAVLEHEPDLVILGGGDGTISGLVDKLVGRDVVLGVLPFGTANSFVRSMGIPLDIEGAIRVIAEGEPRRIDLGMIDDDYFANCAAIGLSPKIAETVPDRLKRYLGRVGYLAWATLQFAKFKSFTVVVGEGEHERRVQAVEVRISNGPFHGGTELVDCAEVDSGTIIVEAVQGHFRRRLLKNWGASVLRLPARTDDVIDFRGTSLKLRTEPPLPISIDGEVLARTPVTARIAAGVIEVMAPGTTQRDSD